MIFVVAMIGVTVGLIVVGVVFSRVFIGGKMARLILQLVSKGLVFFNVVLVAGFLVTQAVYAQQATNAVTVSPQATVAEKATVGYGMGLLAAALAVAIGALGGGIAVGMAASAGMGALAENPKLFGNILIFVGLAEGIAIYGLVVALFILQKL